MPKRVRARPDVADFFQLPVRTGVTCEAAEDRRDHPVAARQVEGERGRRGDAGALEQVLAQHRPRPMQPRLHRFVREVEARCGLGGVHALDVAQHEHRAVVLRQRRDRGFEQLSRFSMRSLLLGVGPRRLHPAHPVLAFLVRHGALLTAALAHPAERLVHRDPGEPGGERGASRELAEVQVALDVGVLHDVLGLGIVPQDGASDPVEALVVAAHQHLEERRLAGLDARDHGIVRKLTPLRALVHRRYLHRRHPLTATCSNRVAPGIKGYKPPPAWA